jgi:serine/threonine protein phosphatase PrpC
MSVPHFAMPVEAVSLGWAMGCSRQGAAHERSDTPCQDAYALWSGAVSGTPCLIAAVADGHGDARHDRSHRGAALAVHVAVEVARDFAFHGSSDTALAALKHDFKEHFPRKLGQRWREAVQNDAQMQGDARDNEALSLESLFTRYGTTLLVALVVPGALLVGQIGDGDILLVNLMDDTCAPLLRRPDTLLSTATYSLCLSGATHFWQTAIVEYSQKGLLLLVTDGLADALGADDAALSGFAGSLGQRLKEFGRPAVETALPSWLDHYSAHGSGDDMTLAVVWLDAAPPLPSVPPATREETAHEPDSRATGDCRSAG